MERYLLFDAGCAICSRMAQELDEVSNGWFTARSLRDEDMQALLRNARPDWKWEPTLLEVKGTRIRVYTGLKMRSRVATGVGVRRAWQMAKIVYGRQTTGVRDTVPSARRKFLQNSTLFAGVVFGPRIPLLEKQAAAKPSIILTHVNATDQVIGLLQTTDAAQQASVHFGTLAWDKVYQLSSSTSTDVGYMIPSATTASYTFIGDPRAGQQNHNFVVQPKGNSIDDLILLWFSSTGQLLTSTRTHNGKGFSSKQQVGVQPNFNGVCFAACAGIAVGLCYSPCVLCAGVPFPANPACIACVGCAGGGALFCVLACL